MNTIDLTLPELFVEPGQFGLDADPSSIKKWLAELPLANFEQSADEVLALLHEMNQANYTPVQRYRHLAVIQPVLHQLIDTLRTHYTSALLPLSEKNRHKHKLAVNLNNELALGYRIIIQQMHKDSLEGHENSKQESNLFVASMYLAIQHLSEILTEFYLIYSATPPKIWGEINLIYSLAERLGVATQTVSKVEKNKPALSVESTYKCALLLALCSPYHMMHGEVAIIKKLLCNASEKCSLIKNSTQEACSTCGEPGCNGCFIVDVARDAAPRFILEDSSSKKIQVREVKIRSVLSWFESVYRRVKDPSIDTKHEHDLHLDLSDRMYRDMLKRLIDTLQRRDDRMHEREAVLGNITLTIGLSATHYHVSDEAPFQPEMDEVKLHTGMQSSSRSTFSLVPVDVETWREDDTEARLSHGIEIPRESHYSDDASVLDMWKKVYSSEIIGANQHNHEHEMKKFHVNSSWTQKNISDGGMCIFCQPDTTLPIRVGELVSYHKQINDPWTLGVIRWLKVHENKILEIGIMHLVNNAWNCAARAIGGTGKGCEYFRCMITSPELTSDQSSIIVPTAVFDIGSKLVLNLNNVLHYIVLDEALMTTKSISQFRFSSTEQPDVEADNIDRLKSFI